MEPTARLLVTSLGVNMRSDETPYVLGESVAAARFAPAALLRLLPESRRPTKVLAVVTDEARRDTLPDFERVIGALGLPVESLSVPTLAGPEQLRVMVESLSSAIPDGASVTLDLTHGLRCFPFVTYSACIYLHALRGVAVDGAYYGMLDAKDQAGRAPFVDLGILLELPELVYAVRTFTETGSTAPLAASLQSLSADLLEKAAATDSLEGRRTASRFRALGRLLDGYASAYKAGLPLELARVAAPLRDAIEGLPSLGPSDRVPLTATLRESLVAVVAPLCLEHHFSCHGQWKPGLPLSADVLRKQARLLEHYLAHGQQALAFGLMSEWTISWALLGGPDKPTWLEYDKRRHPAANRLKVLAALHKEKFTERLAPEQLALAKYWGELTDLRNTFMHHGMRPQTLDPTSGNLPIVDFWRTLVEGLDSGFRPSLDVPGGGGRLLISAVGTARGVLFSALLAVKPDRLLVVCSKDSETAIPEALERVGPTRPALDVLRLDDPHAGYREALRHADSPALTRQLLASDEVFVNVTGGTTVMGQTVQRLFERARRLGRPARRFALVDRRPHADQVSDPWRAGEVVWLDEAHEPPEQR